jgi:hypothetical protein
VRSPYRFTNSLFMNFLPPKITEYKIVSGGTGDLTALVVKEMEDGFEPLGPAMRLTDFRCGQTMVKYSQYAREMKAEDAPR